jgi:hypothetical protein
VSRACGGGDGVAHQAGSPAAVPPLDTASAAPAGAHRSWPSGSTPSLRYIVTPTRRINVWSRRPVFFPAGCHSCRRKEAKQQPPQAGHPPAWNWLRKGCPPGRACLCMSASRAAQACCSAASAAATSPFYGQAQARNGTHRHQQESATSRAEAQPGQFHWRLQTGPLVPRQLPGPTTRTSFQGNRPPNCAPRSPLPAARRGPARPHTPAAAACW